VGALALLPLVMVLLMLALAPYARNSEEERARDRASFSEAAKDWSAVEQLGRRRAQMLRWLQKPLLIVCAALLGYIVVAVLLSVVSG
jgi:membrane glycosyltransferase